MTYVDGFVIPIAKKNIAAYRKMALMGKKMWLKAGALDYKECIGEDLKKTPWAMSFNTLAKVKPNETVVFSFIVYKSRKHRDQVNKKIMADMEKNKDMEKKMSMPFDMKRMAYGGFQTIVEA